MPSGFSYSGDRATIFGSMVSSLLKRNTEYQCLHEVVAVVRRDMYKKN